VDVACVLYPDEPTTEVAAEPEPARAEPAPEPAVTLAITRRTVGLSVAGLICALLPFLLFWGFTSQVTENGVLTSYSEINTLGLVGALVAISCGWALIAKGLGGERSPVWKAVGAVIIVLGVLQFVHASSLLTVASPCQSDRVDSTWCR
jgi:hypothetical protein